MWLKRTYFIGTSLVSVVILVSISEKRFQSQQFAIFSFSHRRHEPPHHAPNAFMAQLKFSSRM
jgi:hypothetical protein